MASTLTQRASPRRQGIPFAVIALLGSMSSAFGATTYDSASGTTDVFSSLSFAGIATQVFNPSHSLNISTRTLFDRVGPSDITTWSFNSMLSSFGGLIDLRLSSVGTVGSGSGSESVLVNFINSSSGTSVGSACVYGDNNPNISGCRATASSAYQTYLNFKADVPSQYFDRVVFSYGGSSSGESYTFGAAMITAVPEPETYALMLAGLGAIGFMARRRKSS